MSKGSVRVRSLPSKDTKHVTRFLLATGHRLFEAGLQQHRQSRMLTGWLWRFYYRRKALTQTVP